MWLLFIEIVAAIIAAIRGWKFIPILIVIGSALLGFALGYMFGTDALLPMAILDWVATISIVIMAIVGRKKPEILPSSDYAAFPNQTRIKCPRCAELIMPDAKVCRYCGYTLKDDES